MGVKEDVEELESVFAKLATGGIDQQSDKKNVVHIRPTGQRLKVLLMAGASLKIDWSLNSV